MIFRKIGNPLFRIMRWLSALCAAGWTSDKTCGLTLLAKVLVRKRRCVRRPDHHVRVIELHVTGVAALRELVIGGGELLRVLLLDRGIEGVERRNDRNI